MLFGTSSRNSYSNRLKQLWNIRVPFGHKVHQWSEGVFKGLILSISALFFWVDWGPGLRPSWCQRSLVSKTWNQVKETFRSFLEGRAGSFLESTSKPCLDSLWPPLNHLCALGETTVKGNRWAGSSFSESCGMWDSWEFKTFFFFWGWVMDAGRQSTMSTTV